MGQGRTATVGIMRKGSAISHDQDSSGPDAAPESLLRETPRGLYCTAGDFCIDPWRPVPRAVFTYAHADHARPGCGQYLAAAPGRAVLESRLGAAAAIETAPYGQLISVHGIRLRPRTSTQRSSRQSSKFGMRRASCYEARTRNEDARAQ